MLQAHSRVVYEHAGEQFVSVKDAVAYSGLTERTWRYYIAKGRIAAYRVGPKAIRLRWADVVALLEPVEVTR